MKVLYCILALFVTIQSFVSKQNDYITFKVISDHKKSVNKLIPVNKTYTKNTMKMKKSSVNKNFSILLRKLQKTN